MLVDTTRNVGFPSNDLLTFVFKDERPRGQRTAEPDVDGEKGVAKTHEHAPMVDGHASLAPANRTTQARTGVEPARNEQQLEKLVELEAVASMPVNHDFAVKRIDVEGRRLRARDEIGRFERNAALVSVHKVVEGALTDRDLVRNPDARKVCGFHRVVKRLYSHSEPPFRRDAN